MKSEMVKPETVESWIKILKPACKFRIAGKYACNAILLLEKGQLALAKLDLLDGHFVSAEDGDTTFLPVLVALEHLGF